MSVMHKVVVKGTFVEVEDVRDDSDERQPLLRSQTTTDIWRFLCDEVALSEGQAEYVCDGAGWEKTGNIASTKKDRRLLSRPSEEKYERHVCQTRTESTHASCMGNELVDEVTPPIPEVSSVTIAYLTEEQVSEHISSSTSETSSEEELPAHVNERANLNQRLERCRGKQICQRASGHQEESEAWAFAQQQVFAMQPRIMGVAWSYPAAMVPWQIPQLDPMACTPAPQAFLQPAAATGVATRDRKERHAATQPAIAAVGADGHCQQTDVPSPARTTLTLRNIPSNYTRAVLRRLLDSQGFAGRYDFVYLPYDSKMQSGIGFAFVNLMTHEDAELMRQHLTGFGEWETPSSKTCVVGWSGSDQQGLQANVDRYRNSPVMHKSVAEKCKPLMLVNGVPVPFPHPTRKVLPPRSLKRATAFEHERLA